MWGVHDVLGKGILITIWLTKHLLNYSYYILFMLAGEAI